MEAKQLKNSFWKSKFLEDLANNTPHDKQFEEKDLDKIKMDTVSTGPVVRRNEPDSPTMHIHDCFHFEFERENTGNPTSTTLRWFKRFTSPPSKDILTKIIYNPRSFHSYCCNWFKLFWHSKTVEAMVYCCDISWHSFQSACYNILAHIWFLSSSMCFTRAMRNWWILQ